MSKTHKTEIKLNIEMIDIAFKPYQKDAFNYKKHEVTCKKNRKKRKRKK